MILKNNLPDPQIHPDVITSRREVRFSMPDYAKNSNAIGEDFQLNAGLFAQYAVQPTQQFALGKLYGIGIGKAILKESLLQNQPQTVSPTSQLYNPDAVPNKNGGYDKTSNWDGYMSSSLPGMPVMCYLKLKGGSYTDLQGDTIDFPDVIFETVLISLTMGKDIKKTRITGRNTGTVKEYNGQGDWQINIRAIITADAPVNTLVPRSIQSGKYPRDNMHQVWQMLQAPISIPVECWYLNMFDINYITIDEGTRIDQIEGEYNMQRLEIPALSDHPLVITLSS
jgi:hypothetical protein